MADQLGLDLEEQPRAPRTDAREAFHVRSHVTAEEAAEGEARAASQDDQVLAFFRACSPGRRWTPSEAYFYFSTWPITSLRRSFTNLTVRGLLVHYPADRRPGPRGARESTWGLA